MWGAIGCAALILALAGHARADDVTAIARATQRIDAVRRLEHVPGISVAVVRNGELIWATGRGLASVQPRRPARADTVYEIGSLGKQFTAVMAERLALEGALNLDMPLAHYLPAVPVEWADVTLRRLLIHQSGVAQIAPPDSTLLDLTHEYSAEAYTALATSVPLDFSPGSANAYSDTGYVLLGFVLDRVAGRFYGDWMTEHLFTPLRMDSTRIIDMAHLPVNLAEGYEPYGRGLRRQRTVSDSLNRTADGSLWSTVLDLARWEAALADASVLPEPTLQRMWMPATLAGGRAAFYHYGEGWEANRLRTETVIEYDGSWQGFHGAMARYPGLHLSVVVLGNQADWRAQRLMHDIAGDFEPAARPYRAGATRAGSCAEPLKAWLATRRRGDDALARELRAIGRVTRVAFAESRAAGPDGDVYLVQAEHMDDWMTVRCRSGAVDVLDVVREY